MSLNNDDWLVLGGICFLLLLGVSFLVGVASAERNQGEPVCIVDEKVLDALVVDCDVEGFLKNYCGDLKYE